MNKRVILSSILVLLLTACGKSADDQSIDLRFMAAEQTGAWYSLAVGITQEMKKQMPGLGNISILPGGGISNAVGVDQGTAQLGFSQASSIVDAINGDMPFRQPADHIQYLLSLFPHKTHVVVLNTSDILSIEDLRGRHVNVGPKGLLTEDIARRLVELYGMTYEDLGSVQNLSFSDSVVQMKDGQLDALFWTSPVPFAVLIDLAQSEDIRLINIPDDKIEDLIVQNRGFDRGSIPAGTYEGVNYDINTIQSSLVLIANDNTPDEVVYYASKVVYEKLSNLKQISPYMVDVEQLDLFVNFDVPVHPAAKQFFTEAGLTQ